MNKQEYGYANNLFFMTIVFIVLMGLTGVYSLAASLVGTDDYVFRVSFSVLEFLIPLSVYLFLARKKLPTYSEYSTAHEVMLRLGLRSAGIKKLVLSLAAGISLLPFLYLINSLSLLMVKDKTTQAVMESAGTYPLVLMVITVAVIPPLSEEIIYRGVYFNTYKRAGVLPAAILSAVMFGLMHSNLNQFAYATCAGFLLAMFAHAAGSTICSFIMHFCINLSSLLIIYYPDAPFPYWMKNSMRSVGEILSNLLLPSLVGLCLAGEAYYLLIRGRKEEERTDDEFKSVFDPTLIMGLIIMLVNMIANELA